MKTLLYVFFLAFAMGSFSQNPPPPSAIVSMATWNYDTDYQDYVYLKDTENKFDFWEGTWQYTSGSTTFTIVFTKYEMVYSEMPDTALTTNKAYGDELIGGYQYIENGTEICNTLNYNFPDSNPWLFPDESPINAVILNYVNSNSKLQIWYHDSCDNSQGVAYLELLPGSTTQAQWRLTRIEPYDDHYSVPNSAILTKIN